MECNYMVTAADNSVVKLNHNEKMHAYIGPRNIPSLFKLYVFGMKSPAKILIERFNSSAQFVLYHS